mmetsp:Transcript_9817/g.23722  ORF Transcript_9817/g.23722 Transcript_9817/m.23722 type:complete len:260 (-) Transcript_9817:1017-1796(-)
MSLSFVSSAVQIGTPDGGFEETPIENKETEAVNRRNAHKPLFEQLRSNQEEDQEKKDELQRQIMRSTCALDEDDVAHLDSIERQRSDRQRMIQERTETELENFRAAKALKQQAALAGINGDDNDNDNDNNDNDYAEGSAAATLAARGTNFATTPGLGNPVKSSSRLPVIKVKKRKRRANATDTNSKHEDTEKGRCSKQKVESKSDAKVANEACAAANTTDVPSGKKVDIPLRDGLSQNNNIGGLGSLLSGYETSSDEED